MRILWMIVGVWSLALLVACGGSSNGASNSASNSNPVAPVTPPPALTAQGVYSGRTSAGITFETIVLPNDKLYAIYGPGSGNTFYGAGIVTGQGTSNNGQYTANITDYYYTGLVSAGTVSASYVAGSSINGTLTEPCLRDRAIIKVHSLA